MEIRQAQADLTRVYQALAIEHPRDYAPPVAALTPVRRFFLGAIEEPLLFWMAVGVLLLMTCANVAGLLLVGIVGDVRHYGLHRHPTIQVTSRGRSRRGSRRP